MVGCILFTLFMYYILNYSIVPVKNELMFGVLKLLKFIRKSNNFNTISNTFNMLLKKVGQGLGFLLDKQISVSASLTIKSSGWKDCIYQFFPDLRG